MSSYDWSQFHVRMYYLAPIERVFRYFSTAEGLESFFIYKAVHTAADGTSRKPDEQVQAGDRYHWTYVHYFAHGGEFLHVAPNSLVSFTFGTMTVDVHFRDVGEATEVDLHQTNCATVDPGRAWQHVNCRSCWIYFMTNLRSVITGGPDLRDYENPNWNDSVSIGFDPDSDPGQPRQVEND
jgi:uncharacterized protein YndB with AHSA1/START domain